MIGTSIISSSFWKAPCPPVLRNIQDSYWYVSGPHSPSVLKVGESNHTTPVPKGLSHKVHSPVKRSQGSGPKAGILGIPTLGPQFLGTAPTVKERLEEVQTHPLRRGLGLGVCCIPGKQGPRGNVCNQTRDWTAGLCFPFITISHSYPGNPTRGFVWQALP